MGSLGLGFTGRQPCAGACIGFAFWWQDQFRGSWVSLRVHSSSFWGSYVESDKISPRRNHYGAYFGFRV